MSKAAEEAISAVNAFAAALDNLMPDWEAIYEGIKQADNETQDILHEIELINFSASEGFMVVKQLQEVRRRRRELKNEQETLEPLKKFAEDHNGLKVPLFKLLKAMRDTQQTQQVRVYSKKAADGIITREVG